MPLRWKILISPDSKKMWSFSWSSYKNQNDILHPRVELVIYNDNPWFKISWFCVCWSNDLALLLKFWSEAVLDCIPDTFPLGVYELKIDTELSSNFALLLDSALFKRLSSKSKKLHFLYKYRVSNVHNKNSNYLVYIQQKLNTLHQHSAYVNFEDSKHL